MKYRPEVDGLRAVAVIPVILFHAGFSFFSGGYIGVDIFFVISGYLITAIIYRELEKGQFSIFNFYEKRSRRILPLLFFIVIVSIPFAWFGLFNLDMIDFSQSLVAIPAFSSNFLFWLEADYFDTASELKPLLHTWSLAVEEQFYLFFPLTMLMVWKYKKRLILPSIVFIGILSLIFSQWASVHYPTANFYLLPSRAWELAFGAVAALIIHKHRQVVDSYRSLKTANFLSWIGFFMIIYSATFFDGETPYPSLWTLLPTAGTTLIILLTDKSTSLGRFLSNKAFVLIGLLSYSAYLWHQPLFAFTRHMFEPEPSIILSLALSIIVLPISYLSWKYIENPFRNKEKFSRTFIFSFSFIGSVLIMGLGFYGYINNGLPNRSLNKKLQVLQYEPDNRLLQEKSWKILREIEAANNGLWFNETNTKPNLLLIGNSHSKDMFNILSNSTNFKKQFQAGRISTDISEIVMSNYEIRDNINYKMADIVFVVARYYDKDLPYIESVVQKFIEDDKYVIISKEIFEFKISSGKTQADIIVQDYIREGINFNDENDVKKVISKINKAYYLDFTNNQQVIESDKIIDGLKFKENQLFVVNRMDYICDSNKELCHSINLSLEKFFYDYGHHTTAGAEYFGHQIDAIGWLDFLKPEDF